MQFQAFPMKLALVLALLTSSYAVANVPTFPDNIVVFPDRDFVSIEGFEQYVDELATVKVLRVINGKEEVIGAAQAKVEAGGVAFEINHPGGQCWGNFDGAPPLTPDIQGGDTVTVTIAGETWTTLTSRGAVTSVELLSDGVTLVVNGVLDEDFKTSQIEQRIIAPDLRDTEVARRDVRALPGQSVLADKGGYESGLVITGSTFTATYKFDVASSAQIALEGGARLMAWQAEDADANRQGLTIAEFGEVGGPGFGGCPNGPRQSGPPAPTNIVAQLVSGGIKLQWTPAVAIPGTEAIDGYRVRVFEAEGTAQPEFGSRIYDPASKGTTVNICSGFDSTKTYLVEVSSVQAVSRLETAPPQSVPVMSSDSTPPTIATSPLATTIGTSQVISLPGLSGKVTLMTPDESSAVIYYLPKLPTDVCPVIIDAGGSALTDAIQYSEPIAIDASTLLCTGAIDLAGNRVLGEYLVTLTTGAAAPEAPTGVAATSKPGAVVISWTASSTDSNLPVTQYTIRAYLGSEATDPPERTVVVKPVPTLLEQTVALTSATEHTITVTATNDAGESEASTPIRATPEKELAVNLVATDTLKLRPLPGQAPVEVKFELTATTGAMLEWVQDTTGAGCNRQKLTWTTSNTGATAILGAVDSTSIAITNFNGPICMTVKATLGGVTKTTPVARVSISTGTVTASLKKNQAAELRITGSAGNGPVTVCHLAAAATAATQLPMDLAAGTNIVTLGTYDVKFKPRPTLVTRGSLFVCDTSGRACSGAMAVP